MSALKHFTEVWERENAITRRVLHAVPPEQAEFRPTEQMKTARELAFVFTLDQGGIAAALSGEWTWPPEFPKAAPETLEEVLGAFEASTAAVRHALANVLVARLDEKVPFYVGPKTPGDVTVQELIWFLVHDTVHHRGQLSTYLRVMGAKVPSIYGPSADEPW